MIKTLAKSIREYKKPSILAPVLVTGEVIMECIIPFIIANLVNEIQMGIDMPTLLGYAAVLIVMAGLSLAFGALVFGVLARLLGAGRSWLFFLLALLLFLLGLFWGVK